MLELINSCYGNVELNAGLTSCIGDRALAFPTAKDLSTIKITFYTKYKLLLVVNGLDGFFRDQLSDLDC